MGYWHGIGRRGGEDNLWTVTATANREVGGFRGRIFDGIHNRWTIKYEVSVRKDWHWWRAGLSMETLGYYEEHYGLDLHLLPLSLYLNLDTKNILPKPTKERCWKLVAGFGDGIANDVAVHYSLGPGGINPAWRDRQGRKRVGVFSLLDWLLGRNKVETVKGEPYDLDVPLPERVYHVEATPTVMTWKRPRWPWWPFTIVRRYADIKADKDPLPHPGNMESDFWHGEDAIYGIGVEDGTPRQVGQRVAERVMETRKRYGAGYDWRPKERVR